MGKVALRLSKEDLPDGWIFCRSKSLPDMIYYYNIMTRISQWEHPVACILENSKHEVDETSSTSTGSGDYSNCEGSSLPPRCNDTSTVEQHQSDLYKYPSTETSRRNSTNTPSTEKHRKNSTNTSSTGKHRKTGSNTPSAEKHRKNGTDTSSTEKHRKYCTNTSREVSDIPMKIKEALLKYKAKQTESPKTNAKKIKTKPGDPKYPQKERESKQKVLASVFNNKVVQGTHIRFQLKSKRKLIENVLADDNVLTKTKSPKCLLLKPSLSEKQTLKKFLIAAIKHKKEIKPNEDDVSCTANSSNVISDCKDNLAASKFCQDSTSSSAKASSCVSTEHQQLLPAKENKFVSIPEVEVPRIYSYSVANALLPSSNIKGNDSTSVPETSNTVVEDNPVLFSAVEGYCSPDVEMLDVSSDVLSLEDFREPMQLDETARSNHFYIVVDTNVLISDLKFVDQLKDAGLSDMSSPVIYIPWVVLQELDKLKQKHNSTTEESAKLRSKASEAIRFLYSLLKAKHPQICGQTAKMAADCSTSNVECNDDQILMCCLKLIEKGSEERVLLLTDDKNLCNKAFIHDIKADTRESLKESLKKYGISLKKAARVPASRPLKKSNINLQVCKELNSIFDETKNCLKCVLEDVFVRRMNETFGHGWQNSFFCQPPWSLTDVISFIKFYWETSFGNILTSDFLKHVEIICCEIPKIKDVPDINSIARVISSLEAVCQELRNQYAEFDSALGKTAVLKYRCELLCQNHSNLLQSCRQNENIPQTSIESSSCHEHVFAVFKHLWNLINNLSGLILDCCDCQHSFVYDKPNTLPDKKDIVQFFPEFYANLYELWKRMQKVLDDRTMANENNTKLLYDSLVRFVPALKIEICPPPLNNFSPSRLKSYCLDENNRELLQNGYMQLREFHSALTVCIKKISPQQNKENSSVK